MSLNKRRYYYYYYYYYYYNYLHVTEKKSYTGRYEHQITDERLPERIMQLLKRGMRGHSNKAGMKDGSGKE